MITSNEAKKPAITIMASYITELIFRVPRIMKIGETIEGCFETGYGGKGFNMSIASSRAGADVQVIMKVGKDSYGDTAVSMLKENGVKTEHVFRSEEAPSGAGAILLLPEGDNAIAIDSGANALLAAEEISLCSEAILSSKVILSPLEMPADAILHAFSIARSNNVTTILNPAPAPVDGLASELINQTDILTPNETEAETLTGIALDSDSNIEKAATELIGMGFKSVVITLGKRGAYYHHGNEKGFVAAPSVKAIDTTGAGDAFNGALATALSQRNNLRDSVAFGIKTASLKVTRRGTAVAMPTLEEIQSSIL